MGTPGFYASPVFTGVVFQQVGTVSEVMYSGWVQCIYHCSLSPEEYLVQGGHRLVAVRSGCPRCGWCGKLRRHGSYERGISTNAGLLIRIHIARFLCQSCHHTISYLPAFAFTYRLIQVATFEAFLEGRFQRPDVRRREDLLRQYRRRMQCYGNRLLRIVQKRFGRAPPGPDQMWPFLKTAYGALDSATCRLVTQFEVTVFGQYRCHQTAIKAKGLRIDGDSGVVPT